MSRSKHAVELCALLVDETYGELTSRIFTILLQRGRLPIYQLSAHTRLTRRQIQHGLAVLIQQNLVYHFFDQNNSTTYYEANHDGAYGLVRSGKIMELVEGRYGVLAKDVVQNLLLLGHTKVSDLAEAYESVSKPQVNGKSNGRPSAKSTNGQAKDHITSAAQLDSTLCELLQSGLIEPVQERMFRSPTDSYNQVEEEILQETFGGSTKGTKQKDELKAKVRNRLKSLRDEGREWKQTSNKRPLNGDIINGLNGHGKKRKLSNGEGAVNGKHVFEDEAIRLERDLVVRINYEKCTVALRNQQLVDLAANKIGETTSQVYAELLRLLEENIPRCRLDPRIDDADDVPDGPTVTTMELTAALSRSINIALGIGKASRDKIDTTMLEKAEKARKRKLDDLEADVDGEASSDEDESEQVVEMNGNRNLPDVDEESDGAEDPFEDDPVVKPAKRAKVTFQDKLPRPDTSEDRQNRLLQVKNHLHLLAADGCKFIRRCGSRGQGEWTVDFEHLVEHLQESELDAILLETFGQSGHRLARMLRKLGKLDEKQLPHMALMKQKDIRTKLAEMQMAGMVDIQEVPRDAGRTTNRTIFLWYFDADRVSSIILDSVYKAMSRCLQRLEIEKRRSRGILAMAERTDVRDASETETLSGEQMNMLLEIRGKEEKILGQIGRLDELVGIFRDY